MLVCDPCAHEVLSRLAEKHTMQHSSGVHGPIHTKADPASLPKTDGEEPAGSPD